MGKVRFRCGEMVKITFFDFKMLSQGQKYMLAQEHI